MSDVSPFNLHAVHRAVETTAFRRIHFTLETASTNDDANAVLGTPGSGGLVFVTDFQSAGRGRRGRGWIAPPGSSLLSTTLLPERVPAAAIWAITFWTALCVADAIETTTSLRARLQWPNDILLDGRKCCGILCISRVTGELAWVACGAGINVHRPVDDPSLAAVTPPPAFISDLAPSIAREDLLVALLRAYAARLPLLGNPETIARLWEARAGLDGTPYAILVDGEQTAVEATARGIAEDGSLLADVEGKLRRFTLADARVLR